ncbi:hypothetical protein AFK69_01605 [Xenorhabdus sp. GDc328]|nr:hypothetical protein AFK69_01605 [Xenorhabdus sp. GDc328]
MLITRVLEYFFDKNKSKYALILPRKASNHNGIPTRWYIVCFLLKLVVRKSLLGNVVKDFQYINFISWIRMISAISEKGGQLL